jgi:predicted nucleotidyltransferase
VITQETIEEVKNRLVKVYDPLKIYLFGSYAWGTPHEDSDLDILIVIEKSDERRHLRGKAGYMAMWGLCISKDLMVYTKDEFDAKAADPTSFISKIIKDGKELYVQS